MSKRLITSTVEYAGDQSLAVLKQKKRAIIYCRVSTIGQALDGESLEYQEEKGMQYASLNDIDVLMVLKEVKSGYIHYSLREKLALARQYIRDGLADMIIVWDLRRLSRNFVHSAIIWEEIEQAGGEIISISERIDNSLTGKLIRSILAWSAESERHKNVEYANRHWQTRLEAGLPVATGRAPYGWRWETEEKLAYIQDEEEAAVRFSIFHMFVELDMSLRAISHKLMEDGFLPPSPARGIIREKKEWEERPRIWHASTVRLFLQGRENIGELVVCKNKREMGPSGSIHTVEHPQRTVIPGAFPRIVSDLLFERAQQKLATNREEKSHLPENPEKYLLRGHLYCKTCGYKMLSKKILNREDGQPYPYYYCGNRKNNYAACPALPHVRTDTIDHIVWDEVCLVLERLEAIQDEIERRLRRQWEALLSGKEDSRALFLQQEIMRAYDERAKHEEGSYYYDLIQKDIASKENELRKYEEEGKKGKSIDDISQLYRQRVQEFLVNLCVTQDFSLMTFQQKCNALELLGVRIELAPDTRPSRSLSREDIVEEWITTKQAAEILGMGERTIHNYIEQRKLAVEKRGRNHWIHRDHLVEFTRTHSIVPKTKPEDIRERVLITYSPLFMEKTGVQWSQLVCQ